jgi:hypothetical protein
MKCGASMFYKQLDNYIMGHLFWEKWEDGEFALGFAVRIYSFSMYSLAMPHLLLKIY